VKVWRSLDDVPADAGPYAVTIGTFDGVHRGHQAVIEALRERAADLGVPTCVVTLHPHPLSVLRPESAPPALTTLDRRLDLLAVLGVDATFVLHFDPEVSRLAPEEFVGRYLVDGFHARVVVVGPDFRFGHRAAGDVAALRRLGATDGFDVVALAPVVDEAGHDGVYSSTRARQLIASGDVRGAWHVLGRPHRLEGPVVVGDRRGRLLGYPTANLAVPEGMAVPPDGVYAGWLDAPDVLTASMPAAISVGTNPTFGEHTRRVEAYVLDRDDLELYGENVGVDFGWRLRGMVTFDSVDELLVQMADDVRETRALTGSADSAR
jgi:riboflavin kinase/FMN adenylyltransferase